MSEVITEYTAPATYWTLEEELALSPGVWADYGQGHYYSLEDAVAVAVVDTRTNNTRIRPVQHTGNVKTPGTAYTRPATWWEVEAYSTNSQAWESTTTKYWIESEAQAKAQELARTNRGQTRVVLYPPA